jgi:dipeptidyl aminopeptidase/acylaminoacyl peptidase
MNKILFPLFLLISFSLSAQTKKPLDHSVYDAWKSLGERAISNDGNYIVYAINPQEGDGQMIIQSTKGNYKLIVSRGYNAIITEDSRYAIFKIKPFFKDTRQAKIKKTKPDDLPKDTLAIVELGKDSVQKIERVQSYKTPEKAAGWLAYKMEKPLPDTAKKKVKPDSLKLKIDMLSKIADSLIRKSIDSVHGRIEKEAVIKAAQKAVKEIYKKADEIVDEQTIQDAENDNHAAKKNADGTTLVVKNLNSNTNKIFTLVSDYLFDRDGTKLLIKTTKDSKDSNSVSNILLYNLVNNNIDTIMKKFNDAKAFAFDDDGYQISFVAERDSSAKALQKFYKLYYYKSGRDSAENIVDINTVGMHIGNTVSENSNIKFSKDGSKLFFGVAPIQPAPDTALVDFELARLDVWHYNDDYLQPQQLKQLSRELKKSYLTVYDTENGQLTQLGDEDAENVSLVDEGNADWVLGQTTKGNRIEGQWTGRQKITAYMISTATGKRRTIVTNSLGFCNASPKGNFVYWYNPEAKDYFAYNTKTGDTKNITKRIKEPLYDVENDVPDFPSAQGVTGWIAGDKYVLINDVYDIWQVDPNGDEQPKNITNGFGKKNKTDFRYINFDREKKFIDAGETILLQAQNKTNKYGGFFTKRVNEIADPTELTMGPYSYGLTVKADSAKSYLLQKANIQQSELYYTTDFKNLEKLTDIATQQSSYNWLTAELVKWKMFDGKMSEGILYKPENFDSKKKYPIIFYFYERDADGLYNYKTPAPSASTVNVPYFVSNDYLIFDPNIYYKTGEPGQSAYNSVVSAAKYLAKMPWVDSTKMGIQGQSWGGYQVAYLVTRTNMFKAAGAGAPVANMTSAYGGIRWGSGLNRQFQYEKTQSRIGATLWQRPDLYIKNSPLFAATKVNTPLLIMHNDADGSVPWYQGIEYFTALRRLGKKVWLLEYNGEDHNLVERKNRKDLSVRLSQFFDYYLKGAKPAKWIKYGVPATDKGRDWGLEIE